MVIQRLLGLASKSTLFASSRNGRKLVSTTIVRRGHGFSHEDPYDGWGYRELPEPSVMNEIIANCCGTLTWWWVFWHLFTDYQHISGHNVRPDETLYTDEELGIPPDDAPDPDVEIVYNI